MANKIVGTKGDDVLKGTKGKDIIKGKGGDDIIKGKGGNDVLKGGKGDDELKGAKGDDKLKGGKGDDLLIGGKGADDHWAATVPTSSSSRRSMAGSMSSGPLVSTISFSITWTGSTSFSLPSIQWE